MFLTKIRFRFKRLRQNEWRAPFHTDTCDPFVDGCADSVDGVSWVEGVKATSYPVSAYVCIYKWLMSYSPLPRRRDSKWSSKCTTKCKSKSKNYGSGSLFKFSNEKRSRRIISWFRLGNSFCIAITISMLVLPRTGSMGSADSIVEDSS